MNAFVKVDKETFYRFMATRREGRYEYVRGRIVQQMTSRTRDHGQAARRIARVIEDQVDQSRLTVPTDRGVETAETIRYPDVSLEPADEPGESLATRRPALVVEVLSPSTTSAELDQKPDEYLAIASLDAYLVASQNEPSIMLWMRGANGEFPPGPQEIGGLDAVVEVKGRGFMVNLSLARIYEGIA